MSKNIFLFEKSASDIIKKIAGSQVHFFCKTLDGVALAVNDIQAEYFAGIPEESFVGKNYFDFFPETEAKLLTYNDTIAANSNIPYLVHEMCLGREAFSIKAQLKNSCNHVIGVGGIAFYPHQIAFKDVISMVNKLASMCPLTSRFEYNYIVNKYDNDNLSRREKECIYYLMRGMTSKQIGKELNISYRTVEVHIQHIKNKLGCYSRSGIIDKIFE